MTDHEFMQKALALAQKGKGFTSPNPCVGAVIVKDGQIVGKGWHRKAGQPHAEAEAIEDAKELAQGATLYVTLEPCNHFGKTPPCTHKILKAGISRIVVACRDPNPDVSGGGIAFLREKGLEVKWGVLETEAKRLIEDFIWYITHKTPFVTLKCAATLDGFIATSTGDSKWITNTMSREYGHILRHEADGVMIGSGTLHADDPSLTVRIENRETKDPIRIVLDTSLSISKKAKIISQNSSASTILVCGPNAPETKIKWLVDHGVMIVKTDRKDKGVDLKKLMNKLGEMSVMNLLIEGGGKVASSALNENIVNKICYFIAPKILGGSDGRPVFNGRGPEKIDRIKALKNISMQNIDNDILLQGYIKE